MDQIAQALTPYRLLGLMWQAAVWACVAYLLILGALIFIRPSVVHRFFGGFATSWGINFLEAVVRLVVGLAFVAVSPDTKIPVVFFLFGAALVITAVPLAFLYRLHKSQAVWVIPFTHRFLPLMGMVAIAAGALIAWALT